MIEQPAQYKRFQKLLRPLNEREEFVGDSARLFQDAEAVRELLDHPGWQVVERLLTARIHSQTLGLRHGPVRKRAAYVRELAESSGLEQAVHAPKAVLYAADVTRQELERIAEQQTARSGGG